MLAANCGIAVAQGFSSVDVRILKNPAPGLYMMCTASPDSLAFLDHGGQWQSRFRARGGTNFERHPDGTFTAFDADFVHKRWDADLRLIDTIAAIGFSTDFHDVKVLSNGNYMVLGYDTRTIDMSVLVSGGRPDARVIGAVLQEVTPSGIVVFEWKSLDYIPPTDATQNIQLTQPTIDYIHPNSFWMDTDGNILLSCRHLDEVLKINRSTGAIMWRMGGSRSKGNQFRFVNDTIDGFFGFSHQHTVERLSDGNILLFDNGNLRQNPWSRAVIYKIDEQAKTATRTWQYRRPADVFTRSKGSATRLDNGNILIGWGTNDAGLLLSEVGPNGTLHAEIYATPGSPFSTYRVLKVQQGMTGQQRVLTQAGVYSFDGANGPTHVRLAASSLDDTCVVTVERHGNAPVQGVIPAPQPCRLLPARWVVRMSGPGKPLGGLRFDLGKGSGTDLIDEPVVYMRSVEGKGPWVVADGFYDSAERTFTTNQALAGEYVVGSPLCLTPTPRLPLAGAIDVPARDVDLEWTRASHTGGYEYQISHSPLFLPTAIVANGIVQSTKVRITSPLAHNTEFFWRVRARRSEPGDWSTVSGFRTVLPMPSLIGPALVRFGDTVSVPTDTILRWQPLPTAKAYQVVVQQSTQPDRIIVDRTVTGTEVSLQNLMPNTMYSWRVRVVNDTVRGPWSESWSFLTSPGRPIGLLPAEGLSNISPVNTKLSWRSVPGAVAYRVHATLVGSGSTIITRTLTDTVAYLPRLPYDTTIIWQVRSVGRYGVGSWTVERTFHTAAIDALPSALLLDPMDESQVPANDVVLRWFLPQASTFHVDVSTSMDFNSTLWQVRDVTDNGAVIPSRVLVPGVRYFWRVRAFGESGMMSVSATWSFTAQSDVPIVVGMTPLVPSNGDVDVPLDGQFVFSKDSRATQYRLHVRDGNDEPVMTFMTSDTVVPYTGLQASSLYKWFVVAMYEDVDLAVGESALFSTGSLTHVHGEHSEGCSFTVDGSMIKRHNTSSQLPCLIEVHTLDGALVGSWTSADMSIDVAFPHSAVYLISLQDACGRHTKLVSFIR
jgi:hypothetical protein